jgi:hypothetical protein
MKYKMYLVLGDWSDDGHGKFEKILLESNYPVKKVQDAYKKSCKLTGISFNSCYGKENYTGVERSWEEAEKYCIAVEYEDSKISPECIKVLKKHGIATPTDDDDTFYDSEYWFADLWVAFVKLSLPDLELTRLDAKDDIPVINGYWNKNLNVQFGYGLYY